MNKYPLNNCHSLLQWSLSFLCRGPNLILLKYDVVGTAQLSALRSRITHTHPRAGGGEGVGGCKSRPRGPSLARGQRVKDRCITDRQELSVWLPGICCIHGRKLNINKQNVQTAEFEVNQLTAHTEEGHRTEH